MPGSRVDAKVFSSFKNIGAREVVVGRMKSHRRLNLSLENPLGKARENGLLFIFRLRLKRGQGTLVMGRYQKNMVKMYKKSTTGLHDPLTIQEPTATSVTQAHHLRQRNYNPTISSRLRGQGLDGAHRKRGLLSARSRYLSFMLSFIPSRTHSSSFSLFNLLYVHIMAQLQMTLPITRTKCYFFPVMTCLYIPRTKATHYYTVARMKTWWLVVDERSTDPAVKDSSCECPHPPKVRPGGKRTLPDCLTQSPVPGRRLSLCFHPHYLRSTPIKVQWRGTRRMQQGQQQHNQDPLGSWYTR